MLLRPIAESGLRPRRVNSKGLLLRGSSPAGCRGWTPDCDRTPGACMLGHRLEPSGSGDQPKPGFTARKLRRFPLPLAKRWQTHVCQLRPQWDVQPVDSGSQPNLGGYAFSLITTAYQVAAPNSWVIPRSIWSAAQRMASFAIAFGMGKQDSRPTIPGIPPPQRPCPER